MPDVFAVFLEEKYGAGILQELNALKKTTVKLSRSDYEEKIEFYKNRVKELNGVDNSVDVV
jgi:hypothetical protein